MPIFVKQGDLTQISCDAIVNPANSYGVMGGGVAAAIKNVGGRQIEDEAVAKSPINVGEAIVTTPGKLPCKYVIHAPTMRQPAMRIPLENVRVATVAAFKLALQLDVKSIAIPGMGTGVGGVDKDTAARQIVSVAKEFEDKFDEIILLDRNSKTIECFRKYV